MAEEESHTFDTRRAIEQQLDRTRYENFDFLRRKSWSFRHDRYRGAIQVGKTSTGIVRSSEAPNSITMSDAIATIARFCSDNRMM